MENSIGIRPLGPRVVVKVLAVESTIRESGLELPVTSQADTYKAEVIVIGDKVTYIAENDLVLLTVGAIQGAVFEHSQTQYAIVYEADILAVLDRS